MCACSLVRQEFSWGRFCLTLALFSKLVKVEEVSSPFLDWTQAFGLKIKENQSKWRGFWGCGSAGDNPHCWLNPRRPSATKTVDQP